MKKRHSEEQIIRILREAELHAVPIRDLCKQHNVSEQTFYRWRDKYGGMAVADARQSSESIAQPPHFARSPPVPRDAAPVVPVAGEVGESRLSGLTHLR